jgi:NAD+ kinase
VQAEVFHENKRTRTISGLNEILIGGINRTVFLEIRVIGENKEFEAEVIGDGILISTQIGSTAYNINAGGSVLLTDAFSVVANNGLFKSDFLLPNTKSFVTSVEAVFEVRILNPHKQNLPYIVADGQRNYRFKNGDFVVIKRSEKETLFVRV